MNQHDETDPLAAEIEAAIWSRYKDAEPSPTGLVLANPRATAAEAAKVARSRLPVPPTDQTSPAAENQALWDELHRRDTETDQPHATDQPAPAVWIDGHPQLEAIAAAVWEQCSTEGTSLVVDDPRNIAVAALAAVLPGFADELAKHVARAIWALKSPPPPGSQHYKAGWDDGLEAAIDAARDELLRRMAAEARGAQQDQAAACGPAPDQCGDEPCANHERAQAHAEGEHCFCGPECASEETVHGCPPDGSGLTPCCGRTPFELPLTDRISSEAPVTCTGAAEAQQDGAQS